MQDVAIHHSEETGGTSASYNIGCTWVVRSHKIDYFSPAFVNDRVEATTWVVDFRRARSLRRYKFIRKSDSKLLASGETEWVFVDIEKGRPRAIPDNVKACYPLLPDYK